MAFPFIRVWLIAACYDSSSHSVIERLHEMAMWHCKVCIKSVAMFVLEIYSWNPYICKNKQPLEHIRAWRCAYLNPHTWCRPALKQPREIRCTPQIHQSLHWRSPQVSCFISAKSLPSFSCETVWLWQHMADRQSCLLRQTSSGTML